MDKCKACGEIKKLNIEDLCDDCNDLIFFTFKFDIQKGLIKNSSYYF